MRLMWVFRSAAWLLGVLLLVSSGFDYHRHHDWIEFGLVVAVGVLLVTAATVSTIFGESGVYARRDRPSE